MIILTIIRHKTPTEECFLEWMTNHPESFHELDERRFYQFANCVFSYNAKSWLNSEYFRKRIWYNLIRLKRQKDLILLPYKFVL